MDSCTVVRVMTGPLWLRIAADLRDLIAAGEELPSVSELARRNKTTRPTVTKAIDLLRREGLIGTDRKATAARPITLRVSDEETLTFIEDVAAAGHVVSAPVITVTLEGDTLVREVFRKVDDEPHNWARWEFFPPVRAQGSRLAYREDITTGSIRYLKEGLGWTGLVQEQWIEARPPAPEEAVILRPPPGWNVIVEHRTGTQDGTVLFRSVRILRADRTRLIP